MAKINQLCNLFPCVYHNSPATDKYMYMYTCVYVGSERLPLPYHSQSVLYTRFGTCYGFAIMWHLFACEEKINAGRDEVCTVLTPLYGRWRFCCQHNTLSSYMYLPRFTVCHALHVLALCGSMHAASAALLASILASSPGLLRGWGGATSIQALSWPTQNIR